jgi:hypothetical protein
MLLVVDGDELTAGKGNIGIRGGKFSVGILDVASAPGEGI